jgi:hypothetical protein
MSAIRNLASDPNLACASQVQDGLDACLPQRDQERPCPQACPVQVAAGLQPLPEELIPEFNACQDYVATLRRTHPDPFRVRRGQ